MGLVSTLDMRDMGDFMGHVGTRDMIICISGDSMGLLSTRDMILCIR